MSAIHDYSGFLEGKYLGGVPNFNEALDTNNKVVYGAILIKDMPGKEHFDIPKNELDENAGRSIAERFRAVHNWATKDKRYVGGFPDINQAPGKFGALLFKEKAGFIHDVPSDLLTSLQRFRMEEGIDHNRAVNITKDYIHAYLTIRDCGALTDEEKSSLYNKYTNTLCNFIYESERSPQNQV